MLRYCVCVHCFRLNRIRVPRVLRWGSFQGQRMVFELIDYNRYWKEPVEPTGTGVEAIMKNG